MTILNPTVDRRRRADDKQADLFDAASLFPVRAAAALPPAIDFNRRTAMAMAEAIRRCPKSRPQIAADMTAILGGGGGAVTTAMINAYTSPARETHTISLVRFVAFVRATGASWLWDQVLQDEGLTLLKDEEAHFARAGLLEKRGRELLQAAEAARQAAPSNVLAYRGH